ncbi:hypothetical protein Ccrd_002968 [Cynara cardunculus var. scolymus]|uniref:Uncharacterized protein n=1 Tax=Cynara cardunculus var. scolymus TaxID=59895 RepID=A0A103XQF3_CYNCS|nr:hypothetical protein Ccrd_002968 [Cynara cardunculus var. scolymus]
MEDSKDDDDFEIQDQNIRKKVKRVKEDTKGREDNGKCTIKTHLPLRTRTSPKPLYTMIQNLSPSQIECVKEMGFEGLLNMKTDGIPAKLGYYVVDSFDSKNMMIKLENGVIPVTVKKIHEMIGAPIGGAQLDSLVNDNCGLLYVDTIRCDAVHMIRERPCIASWSMDLLRRRESIELSTGGFGIGNVAETLVDEQHEDRPRENEEIDIKRYLDEVEHTFNMFKTLKSDFDQILKKNEGLNTPTLWSLMFGKKKLIDLVVIDKMDVDTSMNMSLAKSCGTKQASTSDPWQGVTGGAQEIVETPTQFFSNPETIKGVDKTIKIYEKLQMPDFSLGLTQEFEEVAEPKETAPNKEDDDVVSNVKPISEIYTGPIGPRASKAGEKICSPYMNRQVDAHRPNTKVELILSNLIFAMEGAQI